MRTGYFLLLALMLNTIPYPFLSTSLVHAVTGEPSYAKWGRLAMEETKKKYPQADIIDYQHLGQTSLSAKISQESFKLWLREGSREWGVLITIQFETQTGKFLTIQFKEPTSSP